MNEITRREFEKRMIEKVEGMSAAHILSYNGIYTAFVEILRDEIIEEWKAEQE